MSSQRTSVNPLALFLKPLSTAKRLAAQQRDHEKLQRERQLRELAEEEGADEECTCEVGCPHGSKNKPPPLTAPSGSSSGASIQSGCCWQVGKRGCFSDCGKHTCKHPQLSFSPCSQWSVCLAAAAALHRQQQPAVGGS